MSLVLGDLIRDVETELLNRDDIRDHVKSWLNAGARWLARKRPWDCLHANWTVVTKADKPNIYTLPPELIRPMSVQHKQGSNPTGGILSVSIMPRVLLTNPDLEAQADTPDKIVFAGRNMISVPGQKVTTNKFSLWGWQEPPKMVQDNDISIFPPAFRDTLIFEASSRGSDWLWNDTGKVNRWRGRALEAMEDLRMYETDNVLMQLTPVIPQGENDWANWSES